MSTHISAANLALRLALDFIAAGLIGTNRDEHGRPAGLRTNILVSLAACLAMIQANLLINSNGKPSDSFVVMDTMRLPLGILSGIGFIGAGAIIKRGNLIVGVTTAATLWFVTVMGLCFGGGQLWLGDSAFALGIITLTFLKRIELAMPTEHRGDLTIMLSDAGENYEEIQSALKRAGLAIANYVVKYEASAEPCRTIAWHIRWQGPRKHSEPPPVIRALESRPDVKRLDFTVSS